jgi:CHASE2 domain-containing sensor protein
MARWAPSLVQAWEHRTEDTRFALAAPRAPGADIVLLLLDDASLKADATPLVQRADQFGVDVQRIFAAGARTVALDFLLPASWSRSAPFSQLVLRHPDRLTLAAFSTASGDVIGPECVEGLTTVALGPERAAALFGFVNLDQDADGVSRRARWSYRDREGTWRPSFAGRAVSIARPELAARGEHSGTGEYWIDHTIDATRFERVSWVELDAVLRTHPDIFRNRLVIVGADFAGSGDEVRVPNRGTVPGAVLHALAAETILSREPVRELGRLLTIGGTTLICGLLCAAIMLARSVHRGIAIVVAVGTAYVVVTLMLFLYGKIMLPMVQPLLFCGMGAALAWWVRRQRPAFPGE